MNWLTLRSWANGFGLDELDVNRQGLVSDRQRARLVRGLIFLFVVMLALVAGSIWQVNLLLQYSPWGFLILAGVLALLLVSTHSRWQDLLAGRVAMLEGFVQRVEESSDDSSSLLCCGQAEVFCKFGGVYGAGAGRVLSPVLSAAH